MRKAEIIEKISERLIDEDKDGAKGIISDEYSFTVLKRDSRTYTVKQKMEQFTRDGFIDRYSGEKLVNPGMLKVISVYFPDEFPYHPHWKTTETHQAYWELVPTIDHIIPIANGGKDVPENWATTSMLNNSIKSNWTLEQLRWQRYPRGKIEEWDGLSYDFVEIVSMDGNLLKDNYIKKWYDESLKLHDEIRWHRVLNAEFKKPPRKLSGIDKEFYELCKLYNERFNSCYGVTIGRGRTPATEEMIEDIKECLRQNRESEKPWMSTESMNYPDGVVV